jgi:hypothetical protein
MAGREPDPAGNLSIGLGRDRLIAPAISWGDGEDARLAVLPAEPMVRRLAAGAESPL